MPIPSGTLLPSATLLPSTPGGSVTAVGILESTTSTAAPN